jgi:hypothetical protein
MLSYVQRVVRNRDINRLKKGKYAILNEHEESEAA